MFPRCLKCSNQVTLVQIAFVGALRHDFDQLESVVSEEKSIPWESIRVFWFTLLTIIVRVLHVPRYYWKLVVREPVFVKRFDFTMVVVTGRNASRIIKTFHFVSVDILQLKHYRILLELS